MFVQFWMLQGRNMNDVASIKVILILLIFQIVQPGHVNKCVSHVYGSKCYGNVSAREF